MMITDLDKFLELYKSVGIDLTAEATDGGYEDSGIAYMLHLEGGSCSKIKGYIGFVTILYFDKDGKFIFQGAYE